MAVVEGGSVAPRPHLSPRPRLSRCPSHFPWTPQYAPHPFRPVSPLWFPAPATLDPSPLPPPIPTPSQRLSTAFLSPPLHRKVHSSLSEELLHGAVKGEHPDLPSGDIYGRRTTYPPDGYIRDIRAAKDYASVMSHLRNHSWLGSSTAALVIKFALRSHTCQDLRAGVKLLIEFDSSGLMYSSVEVTTILTSSWEDRAPAVAWFVNILLFVAMVAYLNAAIRYVRKFFMGKKQTSPSSSFGVDTLVGIALLLQIVFLFTFLRNNSRWARTRTRTRARIRTLARTRV